MLTIPMNIVANWLTPKLLNWWATTSFKRRTARIKTLKELLESLSESSSDSSRQEEFRMGIRYLTPAIAVIGLLVFLAALEAVGVHAKLEGLEDTHWFFTMGFVLPSNG